MQSKKYLYRRNTKQELRKIQEQLGLTSEQVSKLCTVNRRTVEKWRSGERDIPLSIITHLKLIRWLFTKHPDIAVQYLEHRKGLTNVIVSPGVNGLRFG